MRVRAFWWAVLLLTCSAPALADAAPPAVWYRASEACPNGAQFLEKLAESSRKARLAQAGDHLDFVVTLVTDGKQTVGRLERQTDSGIVAIRELRDATCERVADALALSLSLALAPGQSSTSQSTVEPASNPEAPANEESSQTPESAPPSAQVSPLAVPVDSEPPSMVPPARAARVAGSARWSVGLELGPMIGISTQPMPRGELFIDFRPPLTRVLPNLSLRASVVGAWGSSETAIGPVRRWILTSRSEACPVAWRVDRFDLRPCLAFELGATGASADGGAGIDDRSIWAAPAAQLRLAIALLPEWLWLEASGGALVPLIRNEIFSGSRSLYRDAPAVFHGNLGISVRLP